MPANPTPSSARERLHMQDDRENAADKSLDELRRTADMVVSLPPRCASRKSMAPFGYTERCVLLENHGGPCKYAD